MLSPETFALDVDNESVENVVGALTCNMRSLAVSEAGELVPMLTLPAGNYNVRRTSKNS
jgi:hypothetical protein